jgi:hypothetical protein
MSLFFFDKNRKVWYNINIKELRLMIDPKKDSVNKIVIYFNKANEENEYALMFDDISSVSVEKEMDYLNNSKAILEFDYNKMILESLEY